MISSSGKVWVIIGSISILPSMYQSTMRGTSVRPLGAAEGGAAPDPAGHELEGAGGDLLAGAGDADDRALAPALVAAFERLAHGRDIADALEAMVGAAAGEVHQVGHEVAFDLLGVDEVGHAEALAERLALWD